MESAATLFLSLLLSLSLTRRRAHGSTGAKGEEDARKKNVLRVKKWAGGGGGVGEESKRQSAAVVHAAWWLSDSSCGVLRRVRLELEVREDEGLEEGEAPG
ncbi:hypothetical protein T484DRAFT_1760176 [Baffinella frigidus]|nr:hypothetical protein T484DRAFT_1760176 [Cryptophyta sp. CCMP2293]